ncbi:MAG: phage holin family protein [Chlamydiales bacterium]|nr:phage holin family protein [Chlamydiales bacterium]
MWLFVARLVITTGVIVACAHIIPGLEVKDLSDTLFFGLILGLVNSIIRPVLVFLTLPINIITLGLFSLVINAFTFWLASEIAYGIHITSIWGALMGGGIIWVTGILTNRFIWERY